MELKEIKEHWDKLAEKYAEDLKSTTKTPTIKKLEINAFVSAIEGFMPGRHSLSLFEAGCGNGYNCFGIAEVFPGFKVTGADYSSQMIENAEKLKQIGEYNNVNFLVGDILHLDENEGLDPDYDVIITNRCIINLNTIELQLTAMKQLAGKLKPGGFLMNIENSMFSYNNQNECREALGLQKRTPDSYNLFLEEDKFIEYATNDLGLSLWDIQDFGSLHDLMLYVLLPSINDGKTDYGHPLMEKVTELSTFISNAYGNLFGPFGQNRLYIFQKPAL